MVGTSFSLTFASNHQILFYFLIATKHRNYNKKVSKQQAYKKSEIHKRNKDTKRSERHKGNKPNGFKMGLGF
jgi:hypothetical protein